MNDHINDLNDNLLDNSDDPDLNHDDDDDDDNPDDLDLNETAYLGVDQVLQNAILASTR